MRRIIFAIALAGMVFGSSAKSYKRGVSENQFQFKAQIAALTDGVTWYYNWANAAGRNVADEPIEYVPMCWSANYSADNIRAQVKNHPDTKYLLGFNEPNFTAQANMTPQAAAEAWPAVQALAKELGLKLVAPALNYSPNPPYTDPLKWMDEFVALVGIDAFDFTAIHSYGGFGVTKTLAENFHNRYGKDVWVTEFCYWPGEGNANAYVSPQSQIACMMETVEWLEKTEWIYRYSWFKALGQSSASKGPNYGLEISSKGEEPRELSEQGMVYVHLPEFDPNIYHSLDMTISAADYATQQNCLLGVGACEENYKPIEVSQFNAGASADYQFDVPDAGDYVLTLTVSGKGEPERYDPNIGVFGVNADGSDGAEIVAGTAFTLPGDDLKYQSLYIPMTLSAGKQTLRIKDTNPYRPSGIRIATLKLSAKSGVTELDAESSKLVDVFSLQGVRLRGGVAEKDALQNLPKGIYIVGGKKVICK